jgi:hypothetical protein
LAARTTAATTQRSRYGLFLAVPAGGGAGSVAVVMGFLVSIERRSLRTLYVTDNVRVK